MSHNNIVALKYTDTALPANAEVVTLFDTTLSCPANWGPMCGFHTYRFNIKNSHAVTIAGYFSDDRGTNWHQFYDSGSLAAPAATASNAATVSIEGLRDFKFEGTSGGNQTTFEVHQDVSTFP